MTRLHRASIVVAFLLPAGAAAQPRPLLPVEFEHSAEFAWLAKPVAARRVLDDMTDPSRWQLQGTGTHSFLAAPAPVHARALRVDMEMFQNAPAPTRNRLSTVNLRRSFAGEDWSGYNRISMWIRPDVSGLPMLPLHIVLHNDGAVKVPDVYGREGHHYVTLTNNVWQQIVWEIEPLARDRVTLLEFGYWMNRMLAAPDDRVAFEIAHLELQRVQPDHYAGWDMAPGRLAFSHSGYHTAASKSAVAGGIRATSFQLVRLDNRPLGEIAFTGPVESVAARLGEFQRLDFSAVREPGRYAIRVDGALSKPFVIADTAWRSSLLKTLNFFYGNRCGFAVPGSHPVDHLDWFATHGDERIVMSGGWHDAGDLSQGLVNTGEATYAMFALAEQLMRTGEDPELLDRLLEEARWGLDWVLRVRFDGGYRIGFAGHNLWTNNIPGDADDRTREAQNNPNVNYIAAAAGAMAARVLRERDPELAERSLRIARDDWEHAITGVENASTWATPAYAATRLELAGIGALASMELFHATNEQRYADKAIELARVITRSQQREYVGADYPLAGFFFTGPDRDTLFHQFHRGNDQAPVTALARLIDSFPGHADWMSWYTTVALYAEYQKKTARATTPWNVLPAYVYRDGDERFVPDSGALHGATRAAYRVQVLEGMPLGGGWYLRAFPVWFARRGNYGVLLSQAKALAAASRVRGDSAGADLAQQQAQWVVGRNPFAQSTMYGEGYDWAQQYSVSSGDFVGSLPVGMQSHGVRDVPYWPAQNMYVYKEVWVHPNARWIWLMADIGGSGIHAIHARGDSAGIALSAERSGDEEVIVRLVRRPGSAADIELLPHNLTLPSRRAALSEGATELRARITNPREPWVLVAASRSDPRRRVDVVGFY
jgi:hypothetical protein